MSDMKIGWEKLAEGKKLCTAVDFDAAVKTAKFVNLNGGEVLQQCEKY